MLEVFRDIFLDPTILKVGHNIKFDIQMLKRAGFEVNVPYFDTMLAYWFTKTGNKKVGLKKVVKDLFGIETPTYRQTLLAHKIKTKDPVTKRSKTIVPQTLLDIPHESLVKYCRADIDLTWKVFKAVEHLIGNALFMGVEMKVLPVLIDMELEGIRIDLAELERIKVTAKQELDIVIDDLAEFMPGTVNLESNQQLAEYLYTTLNLPIIKRTDAGAPSVDDTALKALLEVVPSEHTGMIALILQFRELNKMLSTYLCSLPRYVGKDGRIHPTYKIEGTATGRLSCADPNLQNIPKKGDYGKKIRACFKPTEGNVLIRADYSQMELRMLAHVSQDPYMLYALRSGIDLHTETAKSMFGKQEITKEERDWAKVVNFGIIYGMTPYKLQKELHCTLMQARDYLNKYFRMFPKVREWKWAAISEARDKRVIPNIFGMVRDVRDVKLDVLDNMALNTPIQGACAYVVKLGMIRLKEYLQEKGLDKGPNGVKILLQVHDELVLECPKEMADHVKILVESVLEGVNSIPEFDIYFLCPFKVAATVQDSWKVDDE